MLIVYCPAIGIDTEPDWLWKRIGSTAGVYYTGNYKAIEMLAITDASNCQQKFWFLNYLFASSKVVKVFPILCYNSPYL